MHLLSILAGIFFSSGLASLITVIYVLNKTKIGNTFLEDEEFGADIEIEPMTADDINEYNELRRKKS